MAIHLYEVAVCVAMDTVFLSLYFDAFVPREHGGVVCLDGGVFGFFCTENAL